jgi:SAM-dependent methyltransferase
MQDRPAVIDVVRGWGRLEEAGVSLFAGDFFEELPDHQFDLVLCAGVTHTYDGAHNRQLYRRVRAVLAPDGLFVITCFVASDAPVSRLFALQMLLGGNGGDTHRESDYRSWLAEAGFADVELAPLEEGGHTMLAARR